MLEWLAIFPSSLIDCNFPPAVLAFLPIKTDQSAVFKLVISNKTHCHDLDCVHGARNL